MARNQEKAQAMLNRFLQMKRDMAKQPEIKRPHLASNCDNLEDCLKWRAQILRQVSKAVSQIQNAGLGEHKIRDMNDSINRLLREKRAWEHQIKALGGPDHTRDGVKVQDADGKRAFGASGYFYFGAARELPGVRELFEQTGAPSAPKMTRYEMYKSVDADYYGYRDDDDGSLVKLEEKQEIIARNRAVEKFHKQQREMKQARLKALGMSVDNEDEDAPASNSGKKSHDKRPTAASDMSMDADSSSSSSALLRAHVPLPSDQAIQQAILERRKRAILARYGTENTSSSTSSSSSSAAATSVTAAAPGKVPSTTTASPSRVRADAPAATPMQT